MIPVKIKSGRYKFVFEKYNDFWDSIPLGEIFERKTKKEIFFNASKVTTLKNFMKKKSDKMTYNDCFNFFKSLSKQLRALEKKNLVILFFSISDIIVIDEKLFLCVNEAHILKIENEQIIIDKPYQNNGFFSPELEEISNLPATISYKSGLFSLASMAVFLLNKKKLTKKEIEAGFYWKTQAPPNQTNEHLSNKVLLLDLIYNTELYWVLERCLNKNPEDRHYYFI